MILSLFWISSTEVKKTQKNIGWKKYSYMKENCETIFQKGEKGESCYPSFSTYGKKQGQKSHPLSSSEQSQEGMGLLRRGPPWLCVQQETAWCKCPAWSPLRLVPNLNSPESVVPTEGDPRGTHHSLHEQKGAFTYTQWPLMVRACTGHCRPAVWGMPLPGDLPEWV